jgi:DNA-directed RNA polymerase subunit alpha
MSKSIHDAKLAEVIEHSDSSASFIIKPLYSGYGTTLGNSIRRVLLSSVKGAAITAFSIEGISHEYTTVDGIKEDVVDIMLNLKNIHVKSHSDEPVEISLDKKGAGVVTAADIKKSADIEIANPQQVICTIDNPKTALKMRMIVETGHGYQSVEESAETRIHDDMIALDAIFSPVQRVRFSSDKTRVGNDTSLDQLTITVDTDGTITPKDAFEQANAILVNQYTALAGGTTIESAPTPGAEAISDENTLMLPIEDLDLSARTANALANNDIHTIRQLVELSDQELKELKGFGAKAYEEVKEKLMELNI